MPTAFIMSVEDVRRTIAAHPGAKAILVNNPTYYGICSDLRQITQLAHQSGLQVLADEAHGTHFYFGRNMPLSAMAPSYAECHKPEWRMTLLSPNNYDRGISMARFFPAFLA